MTEMKTLDEQIEELYEQAKTPEEPVEIVEEVIEEPEETDSGDEQLLKPVAPVIPQETPDQRAMATAQWEAREAKREAAALKSRLDAMESERSKPPVVQDPEPNRDEEPLAYAEWQNKRLTRELQTTNETVQQINAKLAKEDATNAEEARFRSAAYEFQGIQQQYEAANPDYVQARQHMGNILAHQIMMDNPGMDQSALIKEVDRKVLKMASAAVNQGYNPAAALHNMAKTVYGFRPEPVKAPEQQKPSLETIEKNKKKSVNGLGGTSGKAYVTPEAAANLSIAELDKLSREERQLAGYSY